MIIENKKRATGSLEIPVQEKLKEVKNYRGGM